MQPIFPVATISERVLAILASLRSRNCPGDFRLQQIIGPG